MEKEGQKNDGQQAQTEDVKNNKKEKETAKKDKSLQKLEKEKISTVLFCFVGKIGC